MLARDIMSSPVVTLATTATVEEAAAAMVKARIGCVVIVDKAGRVAGVVSEAHLTAGERLVPFTAFSLPALFGEWVGKDGLERIYDRARRTRVEAVMRFAPRTVPPDATVESVAKLMVEAGIKHVPVVLDGRPVGLVARHDLLRLLVSRGASAGDPDNA